ncbi:hypothetical protein RBWH47_04607 [Rhodopirellula baltica WH47]|uniref:Uncharacterized protein n=1 Tax=Rhodopirellula baltica WH47 TaxID=991778 RepID=F2AQ80_RHOBT|nr:hypothetical protein RBWH47_04607 [Rhodopirellula baltica WH47]
MRDASTHQTDFLPWLSSPVSDQTAYAFGIARGVFPVTHEESEINFLPTFLA